MNAAQILSTPMSRPGVLLGSDFEGGYKKLMREWHPDLNKDPKAKDVTIHLNLLLQSARRLEKNGGYHKSIVLTSPKTGSHEYFYSMEVPTDTGSLFICDKHLIWKTKRGDDDLCKRWLETVKTFKWPTPALEKEFERFVPRNSHVIAQSDAAYTVVSKGKEVIRVADILAVKGPLDPRHVAWILSSMYNFSCWLCVSGLSHYGFTVENYFVEPDTHVGALLGGWHFSAPEGSKPLAAPTSVSSALPGIRTMDRNSIHLSLIKIAGRRMLGHQTLSTLRKDNNVPQALRDWLIAPGGKDPIGEYRRWQEVIIAAFGKRSFAKYDLTAADVYGDQ